MSHITRGSRNNFDNDYNGNLFVSGSMKEDIGGTTDIESLREGTIIVDGIMDNLRLPDINIACDAALDQDVSQEIGFLGEEKLDFFNYEEQKDYLETPAQTGDPLLVLYEQEMLMDQCAREAMGVCDCCNGTGSYLDCGPHNSRREPCDNCNGTGFIKDHDA